MGKKTNTNIIQVGILGVLVVIAFLLGALLDKKTSNYVLNGSQEVANTQEDTVVPSETNEEIAVRLGLDKDKFNTCMASADIEKKVNDQIASASKSGVSGTPGNFLLDTKTSTAIELGGAVPLATLKSTFEKLKSGSGTAISIDPITSEDYVKGDTSARYVLMEWSDFDCSYCKAFQDTANAFIKENKDVKWVYRQFPLDFHPTAMSKSIAALCAGKIGGNDMFWAFAEELMKQSD